MMARRTKRKLSRVFAHWMLILCAVAAIVSFCLPWVAVAPAVIVPRVQAGSEFIENTMLGASLRGIRLFSVPDRKVTDYAGYRLPVLIWKTESNQPGKLLFLLADKKNLRYRGLMLYAYPVALISIILLMRKRRYRLAGKIISVAACGAVCWIQFVEVGLHKTGMAPMSVYLDYGFWWGAVSFLVFGITVLFVKTA